MRSLCRVGAHGLVVWYFGLHWENTVRRYRPLLIGIFALLVTVFLGRWGKALFTTSEFVHFSVNFPTVEGVPQAPRSVVGGPWLRQSASEWQGYPSGGVLVWGDEGHLTVDLGQQGLIKRVAQPNTLTLSSHWLRNVGTVPYSFCIVFDACGMPVTWDTFEENWDFGAHCTTRTVLPGDTFNMDWIIRIPKQRRQRKHICSGSIDIVDPKSQLLLTRFPISIVDSTHVD